MLVREGSGGNQTAKCWSLSWEGRQKEQLFLGETLQSHFFLQSARIMVVELQMEVHTFSQYTEGESWICGKHVSSSKAREGGFGHWEDPLNRKAPWKITRLNKLFCSSLTSRCVMKKRDQDC